MRELSKPAKWSPQSVTKLALLACVGAGLVVIDHFGGGSLFPGLVGGFAASLLAFMLALSWERDRERSRLDADATELDQRRTTEVRRRFAPVRVELEKNLESLEFLDGKLGKESTPGRVDIFHPQLLERAWVANAPRLSELVADYDLIGELAMTYGRIEELRWRLRYRSEHVAMQGAIDPMTVGLVSELREEVGDLLERVGTQIDKPTVQPLGLLHVKGLGAAVETSAALEMKVIRGSGSAPESGEP